MARDFNLEWTFEDSSDEDNSDSVISNKDSSLNDSSTTTLIKNMVVFAQNKQTRGAIFTDYTPPKLIQTTINFSHKNGLQKRHISDSQDSILKKPKMWLDGLKANVDTIIQSIDAREIATTKKCNTSVFTIFPKAHSSWIAILDDLFFKKIKQNFYKSLL
ncbi:ORF84 [white sturgeon herpesvirus 2]|uniref:ORF85 n=1 Tax=white sturgeon herpesvirus 2 TaxID=320884 RepID=F6GQ87_9VIRU|nr:ORF84 [Acipenserid herpesvirus 2]AEF97707.1 ORF84 [Acipenserid herpesvirus 2]